MATIQEATAAALDLHRQGRLAEAEAIYRRILVADPDAVMALRLLAVALAQSGRAGAGLALIGRAAALAPVDGEVRLNHGELLEATGADTAALAAFRRAVALRPDDPAGWRGLLRTARRLGDEACQDAALERLCQLQPDDLSVRLDLAMRWAKLGRGADMAGWGPLLLQAEPNDGGSHADLARVLEVCGDWDSYASHVARMIVRRPAQGLFWKSPYYVVAETANRLHAAGREADLTAMLSQVAARCGGLDPDMDAWFGFLEACVVLRRGDGTEARRRFDRLIPRLPFVGVIPLGEEFRTQAAQGRRHRAGYGETMTFVGEVAGPVAGPVVLAACDSGYLGRFASAFIATVSAVSKDGQSVHLHVVDPTNETPELIAGLQATSPNLRIGWSHERLGRRMPGNGHITYFTCVRFMRLPQLSARYPGASFVVADIDALFLGDPAGFAAGLTVDRPLALAYAPDLLQAPYDGASGALMSVRPDGAGRRFMDDLADFLLHWHGLDTMPYFLDQIALVAATAANFPEPAVVRIAKDGRRLSCGGGELMPLYGEKSDPAFPARLDEAIAALRGGEGIAALARLFPGELADVAAGNVINR